MSVLLSFCKYYDHIRADSARGGEWRKCSGSVCFSSILCLLSCFACPGATGIVPTALGWTSYSHIPILPSMTQAAAGISAWGYVFSHQQHKIQPSGSPFLSPSRPTAAVSPDGPPCFPPTFEMQFAFIFNPPCNTELETDAAQAPPKELLNISFLDSMEKLQFSLLTKKAL